MNALTPAHASSSPSGSENIRRPILILVAGLVAARLLVVDHPPASADAVTLVIALVTLFSLLATAPRSHDCLRAGATLSFITVPLVLASLIAPHPVEASYTLPTLVFPFVVFVAVRALDDDEIRYPLAGLAGGALLHAVAALFQRFVQWPDALRRADELQLEPSVRATFAAMRPFGLSLSADLMSGIALAGLAASVTLLVPHRRARPLLIIATLVFGAAIAVSRSTTTFLATGGALTLFLVLIGRARLAVVGVVASAFLFVLSGRGLAAAKLSLTERALNWRGALDVIATHPLTGVGPGGYADAYAALRHPGSNVTLYAHSFPLHTMAELGVVLGASLVVAVIIVVARGVALLRPLPPDRAPLVAAAAALLVRSLVDYDAQIGQSAFVFGLTLGAASRFARPPKASTARERTIALGITALLAVASVVVAMRLSARESVLEPFERGNEPTGSDVGVLLAYADTHPEDPTTRSLAARILVDTALACGPACAPERALARARVDALLAHTHVAAIDHTLAARLLLSEGDIEGVYRECARAIAKDSALVGAHETRLRASVSSNDGARTDHFVDEARRWLEPAHFRQMLTRVGVLQP
jgi:putative inorganic carbon (HCO3(-)) transporter